MCHLKARVSQALTFTYTYILEIPRYTPISMEVRTGSCITHSKGGGIFAKLLQTNSEADSLI